MKRKNSPNLKAELAEYAYYDAIDKTDPLYDNQAAKLELELSAAVKRKDFGVAGEINAKLAQLEVERKKRKAQQCKKLLVEYGRKERHEKKANRWKLNFEPKKPWETKSNM